MSILADLGNVPARPRHSVFVAAVDEHRSRWHLRTVTAFAATVATVALFGVTTIPASAATIPANAPSLSGPTMVRLIVRTATAQDNTGAASLVARGGGVQHRSLTALHALVVEVPATAAAGMAARYKALSGVTSVELDHTRKAAAAPSDPAYPDQWALPKIGWDTAPPVSGAATIAVLDTGVEGTNPDLLARLVPGWSAFTLADGTTPADPTQDPNGHGTWLSSIAAAATNNGVGIAGVAGSGAKIMPVQVLGADGQGADSDVIAGLTSAADHGADVILMGFSNPTYSQALQDAVEYAWSKGVVVVAATGNDGVTTPTYPAGDAKVVGVSATDQNDVLAASSNSGEDIFLGAPGVGVLADAVGGGTRSVTGTSAAAALVAGAAALLKGADSAATPGTIVGRLARNADPAGTVADTGNGRLNVARALADTSSTEVTPVGTNGALSGGPFVGPYLIASKLNGELQGKSSPACSSGGDCPWQTGQLNGWSELQTVPLRMFFAGQSNATKNTFTITIDHSAGATAGLEGLTNFAKSSNVTVTGGLPAGITFSTSSSGNLWNYTFEAVTNDSNPGFVSFQTRLRAGAHNFNGASLQVKGAGNLLFPKPGEATGSPDLTITKSALTAVSPGQRLTYSLTYGNIAAGTANNATGVQLSDVLPSDSTFVASTCSVTCTYDALANSLTWNLGSVPVGTSVTLTYQVDVSATAANNDSLTNNALILSAENDANVANNHASVTTTVFTPSISGTALTDPNGDGVDDGDGVALAGATITLFRDGNGNGNLDAVATDPQVGSPITTPVTGDWAFTSGLVKNTRYFVVRSAGAPSGYTPTNAIAETVPVATDHSTATAVPNNQINVVFDNVNNVSQYSSNNKFLARVSLQNQTITFAQPTTPAAYGSTFNVNPTASSGLTVTVAPTGGCTVVAAAVTGWDVTMTSGTTACVLTASQAGNLSYTAAPDVSRTVSATKKALTVTVDSDSATPSVDHFTKSYGSANPPFGVRYSGFAGSDGSSSLGGTLTYTTTAGTASPVAAYAVTPAGLTSPNYSITFVDGTLDVGVKTLHITALPQSKTYGSALDLGTSAFSIPAVDPVSGNTVTEVTLTSTGAAGTATVGPYTITISAAVGTGLGNYDIDYIDGSLSVGKALLTLIATNKSKTYGDANPELTFSASLLHPFVNGDTSASLTTQPTLATTAVLGSGFGSYPITITGAVDANYTIDYIDGSLSVGKALLTLIATNKSKTYGDANPELTFSASLLHPFVNGDTSASLTTQPALGTTALTSSPVGPYPITITGASSGNYTIDYTPGTLTVGRGCSRSCSCLNSPR